MFSKIRSQVMEQFKVCPKTGKIRGIATVKSKKSLWLFIIIGLASVIWVLVRVVPRPSRAAYPCQRLAQPLAASFTAWLLGIIGSTLIFQKARNLYKKRQYTIAVIFFVMAALINVFTLSDTRDAFASADSFVPVDPANSPIGIAKGIKPGRVVWVHDSLLCDQGSTDGWWWEDERTDPDVAKSMMNDALLNLTGITDPVESWDSLFKYFNKTRYNQNNIGYQVGDKIAIKVNNIFSRAYDWPNSQDNRPCPQMLYALLDQLVNIAGVPDDDITIYDCIFYHGDPVYKYCHADFPGVRWAEGDATDRVDGHGYEDGPGDDPGVREKVVPDPNCVVYFGDPEIVQGSGEVCLPTVVSEAKYLINIALPRPHELAGFTGCAKNFFGSVWHPTIYDYYHHWQPAFMHESIAAFDAFGITERPMESYNPMVDLLGHKDLGGKVLLFIQECIRYRYWSAPPFNGKPTSSLFISQDGVAIESVMIDFLRSEGALPAGTIDNYLHESALAYNPPSGTVYDPENDGIVLNSLGAHEHWNNSTDKQYSRNLDTGEGIELIKVLNNTTDVNSDYVNLNGTFKLYANYPNPFNPTTNITYSIGKSGQVNLKIYDNLGRLVKTLVNEYKKNGNYSINFSASDLSSGTYFYQLDVNNFIETKKMILLK